MPRHLKRKKRLRRPLSGQKARNVLLVPLPEIISLIYSRHNVWRSRRHLNGPKDDVSVSSGPINQKAKRLMLLQIDSLPWPTLRLFVSSFKRRMWINRHSQPSCSDAVAVKRTRRRRLRSTNMEKDVGANKCFCCVSFIIYGALTKTVVEGKEETNERTTWKSFSMMHVSTAVEI